MPWIWNDILVIVWQVFHFYLIIAMLSIQLSFNKNLQQRSCIDSLLI